MIELVLISVLTGAVAGLLGIREILVISAPRDLPAFRDLLGDGSRFGLRLDYCEQPSPDGLAQAFILGREFVDGEPACLVLGDNILYGHGLSKLLQRSAETVSGVEQGGNIGTPDRPVVVDLRNPARMAVTGRASIPGWIMASSLTRGGGQAALYVAALHFVEQRRHDPRARRADGVATGVACESPGCGSRSCLPWRSGCPRDPDRCPLRRRTAYGRHATTERRR